MDEQVRPVWPKITIDTDPVTGKPHLTWTGVEGATEYEVYRATSRTGQYIRMWTVKDTSYHNTTAKPGLTYYYKIRALGEETMDSDVAYITCDCAQPKVSIKTDLASGKPVLSWEAVDGARDYEVYRAASRNGTFQKMWTVSDPHYRNTTAVPGTTYYYKVRALNAHSHYGDSAMSNVAYITCDCAAPQVSIVRDEESGRDILMWEPVDGAALYEISRSTHEDGVFMRILSTEDTVYPLPPMAPGKYFYRVSALCQKSVYGNSAESTPVCAVVE